MSSTMRQAGLMQHGALTMTMIGAIPTGRHIKSGYITIIKIQTNLPEIRIQKVQNPIVFIVINRI